MRLVFTSFFVCLTAVGAAQAGSLETACVQSDRGKGKARLCACVQKAADDSLSIRDQRRAESFFDNPDLAERMRMSDRPRDERFWDRYERFTKYALRLCRAFQ